MVQHCTVISHAKAGVAQLGSWSRALGIWGAFAYELQGHAGPCLEIMHDISNVLEYGEMLSVTLLISGFYQIQQNSAYIQTSSTLLLEHASRRKCTAANLAGRAFDDTSQTPDMPCESMWLTCNTLVHSCKALLWPPLRVASVMAKL